MRSDGASLIYTIPSVTSPLQSLIHSSLGIHSLLKRQPLKANYIDRDKVVIPPNWDSWGKIRIIRDGFDVEAINKGWSLDIEESHEPISNGDSTGAKEAVAEGEPSNAPGGAVGFYEDTIRDPSLDALQATTAGGNGLKLEVSSMDAQTFLATQVEVLDKIRQGADSGMDSSRGISGPNTSQSYDSSEDVGRVTDRIGPVQFNMGGIQVDADDMLQRLKVQSIPHSNLVLVLIAIFRIAKVIKLRNLIHPVEQLLVTVSRKMKHWRTSSRDS